jgi:hypothetical protein
MRCMNHGDHAQREEHGTPGQQGAPPLGTSALPSAEPSSPLVAAASWVYKTRPLVEPQKQLPRLPPSPSSPQAPPLRLLFHFFRLGAASFALRYRILHTLHPPLPRHFITQDISPRAHLRRPA